MDEWMVARGMVLALIIIGVAGLVLRLAAVALVAATQFFGPRIDAWAMRRMAPPEDPTALIEEDV